MKRAGLLIALLASLLFAQADSVNYLWAFVKIGDQRVAKGAEHLAMRDGFIVDMVDPNDPNYGPDWHPSEWMRTVYLCVKLPYSYRDDVKSWLLPLGDDKTPDTYRCRSKLLDMGKIPETLASPVRDKAYDSKVLDLTKRDAELVLDSKAKQKIGTTSDQFLSLIKDASVLNSSAFDENSIDSGSYTVGSGGDYATFALAIADLANLTDDLTLTLSSAAVTESGGNQITIELGGHTLTFTSAQYSGNTTTDYRVDANYNGAYLFDLRFTGPGDVVFDGIYFKWTGSADINNRFIVTGSAPVDYNLVVKNCMFNGNSSAGHRALDLGDPGGTCVEYNCVAWGFANIAFRLTTAAHTTENCVGMHSQDGFNMVGTASTVRNCVAFGNSGKDFNNISSATGYNNASADSTAGNANWDTGSNNIAVLDTLTAYESVAIADSSDFVLPKSTGALYGTGSNTTISGHTAYINDVSIVTDDVDVGAKGLERSTGASITTDPADSTVDEQDAVSFYVEATGNGSLSFQWQRHTSSWADESGETDSTLSFTATIGMNGDSLRCIVTDSSTSDTSTAALLTVNDLSPTVDTDPVSDTIVEGATATFFIESSVGAGTAMTFQWQQYSGGSWANRSAATDSTLSFAAAVSDDGDSLRCIVDDGYGADTSAAAYLDVLLIPSITSISPTHGTYQGGDTITLTGTQFGDSATTSAVQFGDSTTTLYTWSTTEVLAIIKAGTGTVAVSLTNDDDQSDTLAAAYTFDPKPSVTSITPDSSNIEDSIEVTIVGTDFLSTQGSGYAAVAIDSLINITLWSDTLITGYTRLGPAGSNDVYVFNSNGDSDTLADGFVFGNKLYWVDGSGDWSDNSNHWSTSSGGSAGASKPIYLDVAIIDTNSGVDTITADEDIHVYKLNFTSEQQLSFDQSKQIVTVDDEVILSSDGTGYFICDTSWNVGGNFTWGAAVNQSITSMDITFTDSTVITSNKKDLPVIVLKGNTAINDSCTISRLLPDSGVVITWEAGEKFTFTTLSAGDWNGTNENLVEFKSSSPGTQFILDIPNAYTASYMKFTDTKVE